MTGKDVTVTLLVDSQELTKAAAASITFSACTSAVTYTGQDKFEFPADVRIDFVRHHDVLEAYLDPTELSNKLQNDVDTLIFETERQIKKNPKIAEEKTARLREYQKEAAEFIEFLSTQNLEPNTRDVDSGQSRSPRLGLFRDQQQVDRPMEGAGRFYSRRVDERQSLAIPIFAATDGR